jgi:predicted amidophosphoribosyltransferase
MRAAGYEEATIIPIPSSTHTQPGTDFVNCRIADAIALRDSRFTVLPALHFSQPVPQSSLSRRRTQTALHANLRTTRLRGVRRAVLLDDLMTTGSHLKAAARFLADRDILVRDAFVVARLATDCPENMFNVPVLNLA